MMRKGQIPARRVVEGATLAMAMTMTMARLRKTHRVVKMGPGK